MVEQDVAEGMDSLAVRCPVDDWAATAGVRGTPFVDQLSVAQGRQVVAGSTAGYLQHLHDVPGSYFVMVHDEPESPQAGRRSRKCGARLIQGPA